MAEEVDDGQPKLMSPEFFETKTSTGEPRACASGDGVQSDSAMEKDARGLREVPKVSHARREKGSIPPIIDSQPTTVLPPSRTSPTKGSTVKVVSRDTTATSRTGSLPRATNRPFDILGCHYTYKLDHVLQPETQWIEYKSLSKTSKGMIPFKVIDYSRKFVTGCLNSRERGVIAFGVGDTHQEFSQGQIIGIDVSGQGDCLDAALKFMLDNLICHHGFPSSPLLSAEKDCITLHFIPVDCSSRSSSEDLYVVEIQVDPKWFSLKDNMYACKKLVKRKPQINLPDEVPDDWKFHRHYKVDNINDPEVYKRRGAETKNVAVSEQFNIRDQIKDSYQEYQKKEQQQGLSGGTGPHSGGSSSSSDWSFITTVSHKIGRNVWSLATMLDISDQEVDEVKYEFPTDLRGASQAIMRKYKQLWGGKPAEAKAHLVNVLRKAPLRRQDIVDEITKSSEK